MAVFRMTEAAGVEPPSKAPFLFIPDLAAFLGGGGGSGWSEGST